MISFQKLLMAFKIGIKAQTPTDPDNIIVYQSRIINDCFQILWQILERCFQLICCRLMESTQFKITGMYSFRF